MFESKLLFLVFVLKLNSLRAFGIVQPGVEINRVKGTTRQLYSYGHWIE